MGYILKKIEINNKQVRNHMYGEIGGHCGMVMEFVVSSRTGALDGNSMECQGKSSSGR